MLQSATLYDGQPAPASPAARVQHFDGRQLAYALRGKTAAARARLAATCGVGVGLYHPTDKQLAALFRVPVLQVAQARNSNKKRNGNGTPTDLQIARIILRLGPDRVMTVLDRLTAPVTTNNNSAALEAAE
jgi:hypothetical protein